MADGNDKTDPGATAAYDALNTSYRMMDEYMRQAQKFTEQMWSPWLKAFGGASPFVPPEQWIRAYGDMAGVWMSMARSWTEGMTGVAPASGGSPTDDGSETQDG